MRQFQVKNVFLWIKKMPFIAFPYHFLSLCLQMEKAGQLFAQRRAINILFSFVTLMHERDTRKRLSRRTIKQFAIKNSTGVFTLNDL